MAPSCSLPCSFLLPLQDFTWGKDANTLVYADLMKRIAQYASTA